MTTTVPPFTGRRCSAGRGSRPSTSHGLTSVRAWGELVYAVVDLAPAIAFFVAIITLLAVGAGLAVIYVGVPILVLALLVARMGGLVQRSLALALLDLPSQPPGWRTPRRPGPVNALVDRPARPGRLAVGGVLLHQDRVGAA